MNTVKKLTALLLLCCLILGSLAGCSDPVDQPAPDAGTTAPVEQQPEVAPVEEATQAPEVTNIDYAASISLDMSSGTAKAEVTVKQFIDGDTTHFYVSPAVMANGIIKARYLAINTPESTGKIEEYGKAAARFTREKLENAESIILESETGTWTPDSTGDRYLCWIWYKPAGSDTYRNLNIEILQNGLAIANKSSECRYGDTCLAAINQAKAQKLNVHSGQPDPDYFYGEAQEMTIKELRTNLEAYSGTKVAFRGVITKNNNNGIYVEQYDPETDMYYGMYVYYGFNLSSTGLEIITPGNEVLIVGSLQYYEAGGTWQVADLNHNPRKPDDPNNLQLLDTGKEPAYVLTSMETFFDSTVEVLVGEETVTYPYAELAYGSSIEMKNLKVVDIYTTKNEDSSQKGAMTLTCKANGYTITIRTVVLHDENGELITEGRYKGKTIDVKGVVDYYNGKYQIKVFAEEDITIH